MAISLKDIKAKLAADKEKLENRFVADNAVYPFWKMQESQTALVRFLPDSNESNTFFWQEKLEIKLPFKGIAHEHDNDVTVTVPCMEMYGEKCLVLTEVRPWWNIPSLKDQASTYWKKRKYILQGFVVSTPFEEKDVPANPIRRFILGPMVFDIIKSTLVTDLEENPTAFIGGCDFRITRGPNKGKFPNYGSSNWSRKTRDLSADETEALETYPLQALQTFLPAKPSAEAIVAIKEMFEASVNGEAYDPSRWDKFYKPSSFNNTEGDNDKVVSKAKAIDTSSSDEVGEVVTKSTKVAEETNAPSNNASEIIKRLKARHTS